MSTTNKLVLKFPFSLFTGDILITKSKTKLIFKSETKQTLKLLLSMPREITIFWQDRNVYIIIIIIISSFY